MSEKYAKMQDRRLHGSANKPKVDSAQDESKRLALLEKARDGLAIALDAYIKLLTDKTLPENRSEKERANQTAVLKLMPQLADELNMRNVGEGSNALLTTCLNSVLVIRDRVNHLHYQNVFLNKELQALKAAQVVPKGEGAVLPAQE